MLLMNQVTRVWRCESPILSVMILTIPQRMDMLNTLLAHLEANRVDGVEVLVNLDMKLKSIGKKRQECIDVATGKYVAFLDDDDSVTPDYLPSIVKAAADDSDVITFDQRAQFNDGNPFVVSCSLRNETPEQLKVVGGVYHDIRRPPWHFNAWRATIAKRHPVPDKSWGEDWEWCESMLPEVNTESHINRILHLYFFRERVSQCQPTKSTS